MQLVIIIFNNNDNNIAVHFSNFTLQSFPVAVPISLYANCGHSDNIYRRKSEMCDGLSDAICWLVIRH